MFATFTCELLKFRRSLAMLLCGAAPAMVALMSALMLMKRGTPADWMMYAAGSAALWSYFMLPMTVTALTILVAQSEHGPRMWNHLLALPVPRWQIFAGKAGVVLLLVAVMMASLWALIPLAGVVGEALADGTQLNGAFEAGALAGLLAKMFVGSVLLVAVQLWAALRYRSFVPPLVLGIGGTFVAVVATGSEYGAYFPWLIPTNALATDPVQAERAIALGFWAGLALLALMVVDLRRRAFS